MGGANHMKKVFFSFSQTARSIMEGEIAIEDVEVLVANTAAPDASALAEGYSYMGSNIKEIANALFPKMVQYRMNSNFVDYFCNKKFENIINITARFTRVKGDTFAEVYENAWAQEERYPYEENEVARSRAYWDIIFKDCGLL